jgi:hypothetical protein
MPDKICGFTEITFVFIFQRYKIIKGFEEYMVQDLPGRLRMKVSGYRQLSKNKKLKTKKQRLRKAEKTIIDKV